MNTYEVQLDYKWFKSVGVENALIEGHHTSIAYNSDMKASSNPVDADTGSL